MSKWVFLCYDIIRSNKSISIIKKEDKNKKLPPCLGASIGLSIVVYAFLSLL